LLDYERRSAQPVVFFRRLLECKRRLIRSKNDYLNSLAQFDYGAPSDGKFWVGGTTGALVPAISAQVAWLRLKDSGR